LRRRRGWRRCGHGVGEVDDLDVDWLRSDDGLRDVHRLRVGVSSFIMPRQQPASSSSSRQRAARTTHDRTSSE